MIQIPTIDADRARYLITAALQDSRTGRAGFKRYASVASRQQALSQARSAERLCGEVLAGLTAAAISLAECEEAKNYLNAVHPTALRDGAASILRHATRRKRICSLASMG